jgi:hypothetical protein
LTVRFSRRRRILFARAPIGQALASLRTVNGCVEAIQATEEVTGPCRPHAAGRAWRIGVARPAFSGLPARCVGRAGRGAATIRPHRPRGGCDIEGSSSGVYSPSFSTKP